MSEPPPAAGPSPTPSPSVPAAASSVPSPSVKWGKLWLAPLTFGGNLPFRRLCVEFGAEVTVGEMAVVRNLLRNEGREFALLRSHPSEPLFGAQLADRAAESMKKGALLAVERGARFVDINCGCPIHDMTRRGLGASLLQKPARIGELVSAVRAAVPVPVTVKVRTGWSEDRLNVHDVARVCEDAGASVLTIHARSREQRYTKAADWDLIGEVASRLTIPVVGNGDILTHYEARDRMQRSGVTSIMLARGALMKPWLFREIREGKEWLPTAEERFHVLWRFVELLREHFRDDEKGRGRIMRFLPWHMDFFCRYRPLPEEVFGESSRVHPLIQTRVSAEADLSPLESLLRDPRKEVHAALSRELIESVSEEEALSRALVLQERLAASATGTAGDELSISSDQVSG